MKYIYNMRVVNKNILRLYENNDLEEASKSSQSNQIKSNQRYLTSELSLYDTI